MIPHNKTCIYEEDAKEAYETVMSGWLAYGEKSKKLEEKISDLIYKSDTNKAVVCSSGTTALYLALYSLGVKSGDEVILPTYTCTAVLNAVKQINAEAVLVDISEDDLTLDFNVVKGKITENTKAIIVIHTYGITCEIDKFKKLNIPIIEDCSQSLGSRFKDGTQTGSKGDLSVFSFYATKFITGGYGGAVLSKNEKYISNIRNYINFDQPEIYYPRFNFLLSDINASVINSQFDKLDYFLETRKSIAKRYKKVLNKKYLKYVNFGAQNYYRFILSFDNEEGLQKAYNKFEYNNIMLINPLTNSELLHRYTCEDKNNFQIAEKISYTLLSIPIYPCLKEDEIENIVSILKGLK
jgi:perosamine synthetase